MPHCKNKKSKGKRDNSMDLDIPTDSIMTKNKDLSTKKSAFTGDFF